jgi:uncharacterized protein (TIGR02246 family)
MGRSDVDELNAQLIRGLETGDAGTVAGVYADDAKVLAPNAGPVEGAPAIEVFWSDAIGQGVRGAKLETVSLDERDDLAVEVGHYTLFTEPGGGDVIDTGKYLVVHRRQPDGSWRYGIDIWNSSQPAG